MQHGCANPLLCIGGAEPGKGNMYSSSFVSVRPEPGSKNSRPTHTLVGMLASESSMGNIWPVTPSHVLSSRLTSARQ